MEVSSLLLFPQASLICAKLLPGVANYAESGINFINDCM